LSFVFSSHSISVSEPGLAFDLAFGWGFGAAFGAALGATFGAAFGVVFSWAFGLAFGLGLGWGLGLDAALGLGLGLAFAATTAWVLAGGSSDPSVVWIFRFLPTVFGSFSSDPSLDSLLEPLSLPSLLSLESLSLKSLALDESFSLDPTLAFVFAAAFAVDLASLAAPLVRLDVPHPCGSMFLGMYLCSSWSSSGWMHFFGAYDARSL
jgi:hypothetical protein